MTDPAMPAFAVTKPWPPSLQSEGGRLPSLFMRSQSLVPSVHHLTQQRQIVPFQAEMGAAGLALPHKDTHTASVVN